MTASPPNDKAMPDVIYAGRDLRHFQIWRDNEKAVIPNHRTLYLRADLQAERIKRLEDALRFYADKKHVGWIPEDGAKARAVLEEGGK